MANYRTRGLKVNKMKQKMLGELNAELQRSRYHINKLIQEIGTKERVIKVLLVSGRLKNCDLEKAQEIVQEQKL